MVNYTTRFWAKALNDWQRGYAQVKGELWGIVSLVKEDKAYLTSRMVVFFEIHCLQILGMISRCATLDLAMLGWVTYIKSINLEVCHMSCKKQCHDRHASKGNV